MFDEGDAVASAAKDTARDYLEDTGFENEFEDAAVPAKEVLQK